MTETLPPRQALVLGLVVVAGLALGALGLFSIGDRHGLWERSFHIWAQFPQVSGIETGTRVRVQGINAGQVVNIQQPEDRGGPVLVCLRLNERFRPLLGSDAKAVILSEGLIGGKVIEMDPGNSGTIDPNTVIVGQPDQMMTEVRKLANRSNELMSEFQHLTRQATETLSEAEGLFKDVRDGEGTMGRELFSSLKQFQQTTESVGSGFNAIRHLPFIGKHVDPSTRALVRPSVDRFPFLFKETDLFEPNRSVLTPEGRARLDQLVGNDLVRWKQGDDVELVVASYTEPNGDERVAQVLTQEQSEAVKSYLIDHHKLDRLGWWRRRNVTALGMGSKPPPGGTSSGNPARRIEILVFAPPQKKD